MISLISLGLQKLKTFVWYGLKIEAVKKTACYGSNKFKKIIITKG